MLAMHRHLQRSWIGSHRSRASVGRLLGGFAAKLVVAAGMLSLMPSPTSAAKASTPGSWHLDFGGAYSAEVRQPGLTLGLRKDLDARFRVRLSVAAYDRDTATSRGVRRELRILEAALLGDWVFARARWSGATGYLSAGAAASQARVEVVTPVGRGSGSETIWRGVVGLGVERPIGDERRWRLFGEVRAYADEVDPRAHGLVSVFGGARIPLGH